MTEAPTEASANGSSFPDWKKLLTYGVGVGAVIFGVLSGFWKIDARLEALTTAVESLASKSATVETVRAEIEKACLQAAVANGGKFICPFATVEAKAEPPPRKRSRRKVSASAASK